MASHYPTYKQSIGLLLIWLLATLVSALVIIIPFFSLTDGIGLSLTYIASLLLSIAFAFNMRNNWQLPTASFPSAVIFLSVAIILSYGMVLEPLQALLPTSDTLLEMLRGVKEQPIPYFIMIVIAAPLLEEIFFRGVILDGFLKNYKALHAILVSAFIFALVHGNLVQGLNAFILGVLFGWIYWKTKSIIPTIILHAINNALAFAASFYSDEADIDKSTREYINNDLIYVSIYAGSIVLLLICLWILHKKYLSTLSGGEVSMVVLDRDQAEQDLLNPNMD